MKTRETTRNIDRFFEAAYSNHPKNMMEMLERKMISSVDILNDKGETALMVACKWGNVDVVKSLLKAEADIDIPTTQKGYKAVHYACYYGKTDVLEALLSHKLDVVNQTLENSNTSPLHIAANQLDSNIVEILVRNGAKINAVTDQGNSALILSLEKWYKEVKRNIPQNTAIENSRNVVDFLLSKDDTDVNIANNQGVTALHRAALLNDVDVVVSLIDRCDDPNIAANNWETPLSLATEGKVKNVISFACLHNYVPNSSVLNPAIESTSSLKVHSL